MVVSEHDFLLGVLSDWVPKPEETLKLLEVHPDFRDCFEEYFGLKGADRLKELACSLANEVPFDRM